MIDNCCTGLFARTWGWIPQVWQGAFINKLSQLSIRAASETERVQVPSSVNWQATPGFFSLWRQLGGQKKSFFFFSVQSQPLGRKQFKNSTLIVDRLLQSWAHPDRLDDISLWTSSSSSAPFPCYISTTFEPFWLSDLALTLRLIASLKTSFQCNLNL